MLTVLREPPRTAAGPTDGPPRPGLAGDGRGRGGARRRWTARPTSSRCSRRPAWSTPAGAGVCVLLDALEEVVTGSAPQARPPQPRRKRGRAGPVDGRVATVPRTTVAGRRTR